LQEFVEIMPSVPLQHGRLHVGHIPFLLHPPLLFLRHLLFSAQSSAPR
jgi:hypothetical protein